MGMGSRTGCGRGFCGGGMMMRRRFISPRNELSALKEEEKMLEEDLKALKEEIKSLENGK